MSYILQEAAIQDAHQHLSQLVEDYNNFELTTHNWEDVVKVVKNMEVLFDFLPNSKVQLARQDGE